MSELKTNRICQNINRITYIAYVHYGTVIFCNSHSNCKDRQNQSKMDNCCDDDLQKS